MDVVRTVLDRLKGTVHVSSGKDKGTTIQLRVPLTLASIQTLLFRVGGRLFAVPLSAVVEITRVQDQEIHKVDQREVLRLREQILTLVRLDQLNRIHPVETKGVKKTKNFVVVIGLAEKTFWPCGRQPGGRGRTRDQSPSRRNYFQRSRQRCIHSR